MHGPTAAAHRWPARYRDAGGPLDHLRLGASALLALAIGSAPLGAQRGIELGVRGSYLPLSGEVASSGSRHACGITPQAAFTLDRDRSLELEVSWTVVPSSSDPDNLTPSMQMAGATLALTRGIDRACLRWRWSASDSMPMLRR